MHSVAFGELQSFRRAALLFCQSTGKIVDLIDFSTHNDFANLSWTSPLCDGERRILSEKGVTNIVDCVGKLIMPGFVDAHCHAPQVLMPVDFPS